jgi:predicted short-subunit dehydrogenase-like oxidoreductase (DUF2520 family)
MNVVLLGSGNTATVVGKLIRNAGHSIQQVWSRNPQHAAELATTLESRAIDSLQEITTDADICLMAVADQAIPELAKQLKLKKKILLHTAGSVSKEVLQQSSPNYGVLYPLQSLRKEMQVIPPVPFLVDGNSEEVKVLICDFASSFSNDVQLADDDTRLKLHLAAVMVSNFTNHLYALAEAYCNEQHLSFRLLYPLIQEVTGRLNQGSVAELQTGPARRGDITTIQKHLQLLETNKALQDLYRELSESIQLLYHKK